MTKDELETNLILFGFTKDTKYSYMHINNYIRVMNIGSRTSNLAIKGAYMYNHSFERILEEITNYLTKLQEPDNAIITRSKRCNGSLFRLPN